MSEQPTTTSPVTRCVWCLRTRAKATPVEADTGMHSECFKEFKLAVLSLAGAGHIRRPTLREAADEIRRRGQSAPPTVPKTMRQAIRKFFRSSNAQR